MEIMDDLESTMMVYGATRLNIILVFGLWLLLGSEPCLSLAKVKTRLF